MKARRVVVTGLGALTPIGNGVPAYWNGLIAGANGCDLITRFDTQAFKTKFACEVKGFDPAHYMDRKEARKMDLFAQFAMVAADEAIADSGLNFDHIDRNRVGVVIGSGIGGLATFTEELRGYFLPIFRNPADAPPPPARFNPFFIPKMIIDIAAGLISIKYGLKGPNYSCIAACATGTNCIIDAFMLIKNGMADVIVAGGSEAAVTEPGVGGFNSMKALSERNDDYKTASRPFDKDRDGFVLGEGCGVLIIEDYDHAVKRGARIYGEIAAVGLTADAYHMTAPAEDGEGAGRVMQSLLDMAGVPADVVDYINVHGTSTPLGDIAETKAIKRVFGDHAYKLNISSTKSMVGHLLGAAGAVEAIASVLSVYHNKVHPTINHFTDDEECDLNYTFHKAVERTVNYAISNTFGFGGHNASLLLKKVEL